MEFPGMWRGTVVYNIDPLVRGRIKVYVAGVYPVLYEHDYDKLPWAEPAMAIFGGSGNWPNWPSLNKETGVCSVPHANKDNSDLASQVWVFFERNDIQRPVYFAICQSGVGWFSEHPNQYVMQTNNIWVKVDDEPEHPASTVKTDYSNDKCETYGVDKDKKKQVQTTVSIKILNPNKCALSLNVIGDVDLKVDGNLIEHVTKNKYTTIEGDEYRTTFGSTYITQKKDEILIRDGKTYHQYKDDTTMLLNGDYSFNVSERLTFSAKVLAHQSRVHLLTTKDNFHIQSAGMFMSETLGEQGETWSSSGPVFRTYGSDEITLAKGELHRSGDIVVDTAVTGCYRHCGLGTIDDGAMNVTTRAMNIKRHALVDISDNSMVSFQQASMAIFKRTCTGVMFDCASNIQHSAPSGVPDPGQSYIMPGTTT